MKKMTKAMAIALAVAGLISTAGADERDWEWSPIGLGLAAPLQLPYVDSDIYGLRIGGLLGINQEMRGCDIGVAELSNGSMLGAQFAGATWTRGRAIGFQAAALGNCVLENMTGLQVGFANVDMGELSVGCSLGAVNYAVNYYGLQAGALNWNTSATAGLGLGLVNVSQEDFDGAFVGGVSFSRRVRGVQIGGINLADELTGVQIGIVNAADRVTGLQIGAINLISTSRLPVMVIANAMF